MKYTHDQLTDMIIQDVEFFGDKTDRYAIYAEYVDDANRKLFESIDEVGFHSYLRVRSAKHNKNNISFTADKATTHIRDLVNMGQELEPVDVYVRVAGNLEDGVVYDLLDRRQQAVKIDEKGWYITCEKPFKFISSSTSLQQVLPLENNEDLFELLKPFINLHGEDLIIYVLWLVQCFCDSDHSALFVMAERGSGKSTLSRITQLLIDPSRLDIMTLPSKKDDLQTILGNTYLATFDNVRNISKDFSDLFCCAITGATTSKRTLYSDTGLTVQYLHNALVINGIDVIPQEADLAERLLMINLKKLTSNNLRRGQDLWNEFEKKRPLILGAIFNVLSKAMVVRKNIKISNFHRMTDSFADMLCIAIALGITEQEFRKYYDNNVMKVKKARANTPLVEAVKEYMESLATNSRKAEGKVSVIYNKIKNNYSGNKSNLPASPNHFTRMLELERETLIAIGYRVNIDDTFSDGTTLQIIKIKK